MPKMQVWRGGVNPEFYPQGLALFQLGLELSFGDNLLGSTLDLLPTFRR
jgi:hypothetical protein